MTYNLFVDKAAFAGMAETEQKLYKRLDAEKEDAGYIFDLNVNKIGWGIEDVAGLKQALSDERAAHKKATGTIKAFEGIDPVKARKALDQITEMSGKDWTQDDKVKAQMQAREDTLKTAHEKIATELTTENEFLTKQLHTHLIDAAAIAAIEKNKGSVQLLLPHVRQMTKVEKDDSGNFVSRVVGIDGSVRVSLKERSTDPMDTTELVELMSKQVEFMPAFKGSGQSGMGALGSDRAGGSTIGGQYLLSYEDSKDHRKYVAAKAAAEKAGQTLVLEDPPLQGQLRQPTT